MAGTDGLLILGWHRSAVEEAVVGERINIAKRDGDFSAYVARPAAASASAVVILREISGMNANLRQTCHERADRVYIAVRIGPIDGRMPRLQPLSSDPKLVALTPSTEAPELRDREVPPFPASLLSEWDGRLAGDQSAKRGTRNSDRLTARECDVLAMISQGCSNKRIARTLEISPETVKSHVKRIFSKLAVSTRTEAVFRAVSLELL
jgi:DNA-binding CsgD family transcriptional regulator